jgi:phytoene dehydrogenase-like protein
VRDVVIVGGGHNGLVAAAVLAQAGLKPLVLERASRTGGCLVTEEIAPGCRAPRLGHRVRLDRSIVHSLALEQHGLQITPTNALLSVPEPNGGLITLWKDEARTVAELDRVSEKDAISYPRFLESFAAVSEVIRAVTHNVPPGVDDTTASDLVELLKVTRAFRRLGKADAYRLLRWITMPVADLVSEWFETESLRVLLAAGGLLGSLVGPRSPASGAILLWLGSGEGHPAATGWTARGGPGAVSEALTRCAQALGAEIRTGSTVREILVKDGAATGVVLSSGERIEARCVLSNASPRHTMLDLLDPIHLPREFARNVRSIRARGTLSKVNFAVSTEPRFQAAANLDGDRQSAVLAGAIRLCPDLSSMERAFDAVKYGQYSRTPWIELTVPTVLDPDLAPGRHVVSAYVQYAPHTLRETTWDLERDRFGAIVASMIDQYAPGFQQSIVASEVITPKDLEHEFGLIGGQIFHADLALDQLFVARPLLGWSRFATPIQHLFLCGSGTHPGTGADGLSGALAARRVIAALGRR